MLAVHLLFRCCSLVMYGALIGTCYFVIGCSLYSIVNTCLTLVSHRSPRTARLEPSLPLAPRPPEAAAPARAALQTMIDEAVAKAVRLTLSLLHAEPLLGDAA